MLKEQQEANQKKLDSINAKRKEDMDAKINELKETQKRIQAEIDAKK